MKLLIIAQAYPPYPVVGAFRAQNIARAFRDEGHEVHVITEQLPPAHVGGHADDAGIHVHAVAIGERYGSRVAGALNRLRRLVGADAAARPAAEAVSQDVNEFPDTRQSGLLKRFVIALLCLPDEDQRFIRPALWAAREIMPGTDLLYTTAPSWSTHIAGLLLRRRYGIRWVADFRDPWSDVLAGGRERYGTAATDAVVRRLELAVLRGADCIVAVAAKTRDVLAQKVSESERAKFILVRNGIDVTLPPRSARFPGAFRIAYTGTFYDDRDPRVFLQGLARLRRRRSIGPTDLRVDFAGNCRILGPISIVEYVRELGLDDLVAFHDWMPQSEARALLARADLLLILARSMTLQVPNKLYEYLGMRIPIFAYADADGETAAVLQSIEGHFVVTEASAEEMERKLEKALSCTPPSVVSPDQEALIDEWSVHRQMAGLLAAVGGRRNVAAGGIGAGKV